VESAIRSQERSISARGAVSQFVDRKDHDFRRHLPGVHFKVIWSVNGTAVLWCGALGDGGQSVLCSQTHSTFSLQIILRTGSWITISGEIQLTM